jgi:hypothetical protein
MYSKNQSIDHFHFTNPQFNTNISKLLAHGEFVNLLRSRSGVTFDVSAAVLNSKPRLVSQMQ